VVAVTREHKHSEACIWYPPARYTCLRLGHRAPAGGLVPIESKKLPWWSWPFELMWRLEARLMRNQPERVRTGLEAPRSREPVSQLLEQPEIAGPPAPPTRPPAGAWCWCPYPPAGQAPHDCERLHPAWYGCQLGGAHIHPTAPGRAPR
jgi:hypothetical protein